MKRLQADIIDASDWDVISSPQADIMRSVLGGSTYQHALRAGSRKHLSLFCPHVPAISLAKHAPGQAHEAKSTVEHDAETCDLFEYLGATVGCSMWTRALEGSCMHAGQEYEAILSEKLRCAGIAFFSENKLREEGFFKTPDVKLEVWRYQPLPGIRV